MSLQWGGPAMYIESHAIVCPACKGHRYIGHLICLECCGNGQIVFKQRQSYNRARLWQVGLLAFIGSIVIAWHFLFPLAWRIFR